MGRLHGEENTRSETLAEAPSEMLRAIFLNQVIGRVGDGGSKHRMLTLAFVTLDNKTGYLEKYSEEKYARHFNGNVLYHRLKIKK